MIIGIVSALLPLVGFFPPEEPLDVAIKLLAKELRPGGEYVVLVTAKTNKGWSDSSAGIERPILQIKAPSCVQLSGKKLTERRELARNEFLQAPFERQLMEETERVKFKLVQHPGPNDALIFNVVAYVSPEGSDDGRLFRKRYTLPLRPGALAKETSAADSDWGEGDELNLGEKAAPFTLPRADGIKVALKTFAGKKNVVVTTYRAYW